MKIVSEPSIPQKIQKMKERVRWEHPAIAERGIDPTGLVLDDGKQDDRVFSFLVLGDSGTGRHREDNPQRRVAEAALEIGADCRFMLHTGDVVYLVGSSEQYPENFIRPYREFLVGGDKPEEIAYDRMIFKRPILPVLGNHDYYDLPWIWGLISQAALPLRRLLQSQFNFDVDVGWHGSFGGDAYARAFLDYRRALDGDRLKAHLDRHYTAKNAIGRCLHYQPGAFTRLPNRYYTFRYGGIDFFALDSNTFNVPLALPKSREGQQMRQQLRSRRTELERERAQLLERAAQIDPNDREASEAIDDCYAKAEQLSEQIFDIDKQLEVSKGNVMVDFEQLDWLRERLIESWNTEEVRGRIIFFHHPPYVTEATKWDQGQTLAIRHHLRQVLDSVTRTVGPIPPDRPLVDVIFNGHAHCLEYLRTGDTGHGDANLNWIVCGGSGFSLRRQRSEGEGLLETFNDGNGRRSREVARSHLYVGRNGRGSNKHRPYSGLRVDVAAGSPPKLTVRPFVVEKFKGQWKNYSLEAFTLGVGEMG
ncbi:MAG: metallophosphoesterase [Cyanobacteriota bacterium]|nr:metallophosphoesterase [Cyanobacteriota bacterium]